MQNNVTILILPKIPLLNDMPISHMITKKLEQLSVLASSYSHYSFITAKISMKYAQLIYSIIFNSFPTFSNAAMASSNISLVCAAVGILRTRPVPLGTVGNTIDFT